MFSAVEEGLAGALGEINQTVLHCKEGDLVDLVQPDAQETMVVAVFTALSAYQQASNR